MPFVVYQGRTTARERVELPRAGEILGRVLATTDVAADHVLVECRPVGSAVWSAPEAAKDGSFRLTGLALGRHDVRARVLGFGSPRCSQEAKVDVAAGATSEVALRLPPDGAGR